MHTSASPRVDWLLTEKVCYLPVFIHKSSQNTQIWIRTLHLWKKTRLSQYKPKPRSISSNLMNMCGRINLRWRASYGYKPFLTSTFASIYQFMIQKGLKSLWRTFLIEIHRQKYLLVAKAATNSLPRRPPFWCFQNIVAWSLSTVGDWN